MLLGQSVFGILGFDMSDKEQVQFQTLAQMSLGGRWRTEQMHCLPHHLFLWFTRGQGRAILHGTRVGFVAHNAMFIPAGTLFSLELGRQCLGQTVSFAVDLPLPLPDSVQLLRVRDGIHQLELTALLETVQRELMAHRPLVDAALASYAQLLSIWLQRMMLESLAPKLRETATQRLVRQFCTLVVENFESGQPMAAYAEQLGITPTHLTRVCKQATGRTAADILTDCTLYQARIRLEKSNRPIKQVAEGLGFASAAYFTRFIQHHTGKTPSQLRKSLQ